MPGLSLAVRVGYRPGSIANVTDGVGLVDSAVGVISGSYPTSASTGYQLSPGYTGSLAAFSQTSLGPSDSGSPGNYAIFEGFHFVDQDLLLQSGAHHIIIRGCHFENTDANGACIKSVSDGTVHDIIIEYNEINGGNGHTRSVQYGVQAWGDNFEVGYNHFHDLADQLQINGAAPLVHDNYAHDLTNNGSDHCDIFQSNNGVDGGHVYHNTFILNQAGASGTPMDQTGCVSLFQDDVDTAYTNWLVEDNLVAGPVGGGSAFYCGYEPAKGAGRISGSNVRFINNKFRYLTSTSGTNFTAVPTWGSSGNSNSGNVWYDGPLVGQPVT